ncbi:MAG TPA: tRNA pseudouridine(38-40) synthase TruA [Cerasibacillus sp.]|uniref:tRNA pseudouridine(38-40) synthase TruA n=1 Tax=Cerasibacillus sp. TaxID=2498711 RepID=UPI002F424C4B
MNKVKCIVSYDGTNFSGFQVQPLKRTVQGEIEKALKRIHKGQGIRIYPSGRTDRGVHAIRQTIHYDTPIKMNEDSWKKALNALLPEDVYVKEAQIASSSFHARFSAIEKEYRYIVLNDKEPNLFRRHYVYQFPYALDIDKMQEACQYLEGEHDFTAFSSAKSTAKGSKVRTLYEASCIQKGSEIMFVFRGNGFLYHMVRILVGTLLEVGQGKREPVNIKGLLEQQDRQQSGKTAPPQGLYLWNVTYSD